MNRWTAGVDVGNTRIKVALFEENCLKKIVYVPSVDPGQINGCFRDFSSLSQGEVIRWVVAGVVPPVIDEIRQLVGKSGYPIRALMDPARLGLQLDLAVPQQVGIDRVLACLGAYRRNEATGALVVDSGTALTINWVDSSGVFRGGSIQPGWRLMARALGEGTARLPDVGDPEEQSFPWPGRDTLSAIRSGLELAILAAVKTRWEWVRENHPGTSLWFTGGGGGWLARGMGGQGVFNPHLVLEGMVYACGAQDDG